MEGHSFFVTSILGYNTGKPMVEFGYPGGSTMMEVEDARDLALNILSGAEAALSDHAVFGLLTDEIRLPVNEATKVIQQLRFHREDHKGGQ